MFSMAFMAMPAYLAYFNYEKDKHSASLVRCFLRGRIMIGVSREFIWACTTPPTLLVVSRLPLYGWFSLLADSIAYFTRRKYLKRRQTNNLR